MSNEITNLKECRICFESDDLSNNKLISPCNCNGTSKYVHTNCLKLWINNSINPNAKKICMECRTEYNFLILHDKKEYIYSLTLFSINTSVNFLLFIFTLVPFVLFFDYHIISSFSNEISLILNFGNEHALLNKQLEICKKKCYEVNLLFFTSFYIFTQNIFFNFYLLYIKNCVVMNKTMYNELMKTTFKTYYTYMSLYIFTYYSTLIFNSLYLFYIYSMIFILFYPHLLYFISKKHIIVLKIINDRESVDIQLNDTIDLNDVTIDDDTINISEEITSENETDDDDTRNLI
tara:strand:+ start:320 stop:1192 length:873 start_codon:yes stop_codon:yes gene_type:complete